MHIGEVLEDVLNIFGVTPYRLSQESGLALPTIRALMRQEISTTSTRNVMKIARGLKKISFYAEGAFWEGLKQGHFGDRPPALDKTVWYQETTQNIDAVLEALKSMKLLNEEGLNLLKDGVEFKTDTAEVPDVYQLPLAQVVQFEMKDIRQKELDKEGRVTYIDCTDAEDIEEVNEDDD